MQYLIVHQVYIFFLQMFFRGEKIVYVSTTSNTEISLKYLKKILLIMGRHEPAHYMK